MSFDCDLNKQDWFGPVVFFYFFKLALSQSTEVVSFQGVSLYLFAMENTSMNIYIDCKTKFCQIFIVYNIVHGKLVGWAGWMNIKW